MRQEMDLFLDECVGSDPNLLRDLLETLARERRQIEQQLCGEVAVKGDNEWQRVVAEVKAALSQLETIKSDSIELCGDGEGVSLGRGEVERCVEDLREKAQQLLEAQHLLSYLNHLQHIMKLCSRIEVELSPGGDLSEAVGCHGDLVSVVCRLELSECVHLRQYACSCQLWWGDRVRERTLRDFSEVLSAQKWPFSSSSLSYSLQTSDKLNKHFSVLFNLLLQLDPTSPPGDHQQQQQGEGGRMDGPLLYPLEQMIQPLRKRFRYHFTGERRTNSLEKPEWCFTRVLSWIRDHTPFLETLVQPLLEGARLGHLDVVVEFTRGLLQEVELKLCNDIQDTVQDDLLMAHLIDELILFSRELTLIGYPPSSPSPLSVLLDPAPFSKWLSLERQFAEERLVELSASPTACTPVYESAADTDDTRVPESAESLLILITGVTDRYRNLPSEVHQLQFVELQRELLQEFLHDLAASSGVRDPLSTLLCAHLNTCCYIANVLREWGEMKFFLSLHYAEQDHAHNHTPSLPASFDSKRQRMDRPDINTILSLRREDSSFAELEGHIFSSVCTEFRTHLGVLQDTLVQHVVSWFRTGCKRYRRENWQLQEREREETLLQEVSPSLSTSLPQLQGQLVFLSEQLSLSLFASVFQRLTNHIDQVLFTEVIFPTHFGVGGANQLNFDLTAGFLPVFSQFCEELQARQLMERSREACKLLQLLPGSAKLLQELLLGVVRGGATTPLDTYTAAVTTLNEFGVHTLEPVQAHQILANMIPPS